METPIKIDYLGLSAPPAIRDIVARRIDDLEQRFGRITACRVTVKGPGAHHQTGGLYDVHVHLTLPDGKEVAVGKVNQGDERFADPHFAINDTFKRARRRLQDKARRLQGKVKRHEPVRPGPSAE